MGALYTFPPLEQSIRSTPFCFTTFASAAESSTVHPFSDQSEADILKNNGYSSGHTDLTASITSSKNLILFSNDPPYSSVRKLLAGDRNSLIRYPCAP